MTAATMPAAVYVGDGQIEVQWIPVPEPGPDELLVEVAACGVCGTDLHLVLEQYAKPGSVLGHEWSGTVVKTSTSPSGWEVGDRIVWNPTPSCGSCRACLRGRPSVCLRREATDYLAFNGAYCRYLVVPVANALRIPDSLELRAGALAEPTAIALHCVELSEVAASDRVLITGGGPVGLLIAAVLRAQGIDDISVSEPSALRRQRAVDIGATRAVAPESLIDPPMGVPAEAPFDVAFECSGRASAAEIALGQLDFAGTLVFVGTGFEPPKLNHNRMIIFELSALGAYNYSAEGFAPALALLASGRLPIDLLIEPIDVGLDRLMATMHRLADGEIPSKALIRPEVMS